MATTERQSRELAAVRQRILGAARELFVRHGCDAVSLRKIAESIGYTAPALYTHFRDKSELMSELCRQDFAALAGDFVKLAKVADPVERIYRLGLAYIRFAREHPNHYRLMFMTPHLAEIAPPTEADIQAMSDPDQDAYAFLHKSVREAMAEGRFLPDHTDSELLAQTLWAGVHGVASLEITHGDCPWARWRSLDRRSRTMCAAMLKGLLRDPGSFSEKGRGT
ncbi:MAG: TetR/AcrR family transcriptional regulator [Phycisphaerales bacterium]